MKTLDYWIDKYEKRSGETFSPHKGCKLFFLPERGFCEVAIGDDLLIIYQLSGDGKFWHDFCLCLCDALNLRAIGTICTRNIKAYFRFWGYEITDVVNLPDGQKQFFCKHKTRDWTARISPAWVNEGRPAYYVTEYLREA